MFGRRINFTPIDIDIDPFRSTLYHGWHSLSSRGKPRDYGEWALALIGDSSNHDKLRTALREEVLDESLHSMIENLFLGLHELERERPTDHVVSKSERDLEWILQEENNLRQSIADAESNLKSEWLFMAARTMDSLTLAMDQMCAAAARLSAPLDDVNWAFVRLCFSDSSCAFELADLTVDAMLELVAHAQEEVVDLWSRESSKIRKTISDTLVDIHNDENLQSNRIEEEESEIKKRERSLRTFRDTLSTLEEKKHECLAQSGEINRRMQQVNEQIESTGRRIDELRRQQAGQRRTLQQLRDLECMVTASSSYLNQIQELQDSFNAGVVSLKKILPVVTGEMRSLHSAEINTREGDSKRRIAARLLQGGAEKALFCPQLVPYAQQIHDLVMVAYNGTTPLPDDVKSAALELEGKLGNPVPAFPLGLPVDYSVLKPKNRAPTKPQPRELNYPVSRGSLVGF